MGTQENKTTDKRLRKLNKTLPARFKMATQADTVTKTMLTETKGVAKITREAHQQAEEKLRAVQQAIQSVQEGLDDAERQITRLHMANESGQASIVN